MFFIVPPRIKLTKKEDLIITISTLSVVIGLVLYGIFVAPWLISFLPLSWDKGIIEVVSFMIDNVLIIIMFLWIFSQPTWLMG